MPVKLEPRAYTLRLSGADRDDQSWRNVLWQTHLSVNNGAKVFGDWLLTLRGGLSHQLAEKKGPACQTFDIQWRRLILTLSWLSVESSEGAPFEYIVDRDQLIPSLKDILLKRGLKENEAAEWVDLCKATLTSAIRSDAVWVNRSKAFDSLVKLSGIAINQQDIWDLLGRFFTDDNSYFKREKRSDEEEDAGQAEEMSREKDLVQKAVNWLSNRYGKGKGTSFSEMEPVYEKISSWAKSANGDISGSALTEALAKELELSTPGIDSILKLISGRGYNSATKNLLRKLNANRLVTEGDLKELSLKAAKDAVKCKGKVGQKGGRPYSDLLLQNVEQSCGFKYHDDERSKAGHYLFAVMLDHAARRVSQVHTAVKKAEVRRINSELDSTKLNEVPKPAIKWLDDFCRRRISETNSTEGYIIRRRALSGWKEVVRAWSLPECRTMEDRISAVHALQDDPEIKKFGDVQLFEKLATDEAKITWIVDGKANDELLIQYAAAREAEYDRRRFKVPAFNHPHPLKHPVFCDFGESRWSLAFAIQDKPNDGSRALEMELFDGKIVKKATLAWHSKRLAKDLGIDNKDSNADEVVRNDRLGRAAAGLRLNKCGTISQLFKQKYWNGRLQAPRDELNRIARIVDKEGWDKKAISLRNGINWLLSFSPKLSPWPLWSNNAEAERIELEIKSNRASNKKRGTSVKLIVPRVPGIRILSVDLGHRYAAACAVWELVSARKVIDDCREAGKPIPGKDDMFLHLENSGKKIVFRRIGPEDTTGSAKDTAMWARLDRQFLIKLQGEESQARRATDAELQKVSQFASDIGYRRNQFNTSYQTVDELMHTAVEMAKIGIMRHGKKAKIAFNLTAEYKYGMGGSIQKVDKAGKESLLASVVMDWYLLASDAAYLDTDARQLWEKYILPLPGAFPVAITEHSEENQADGRKRGRDKDLEEKCKALAKELAARDTGDIARQWAQIWGKEDTAWKARLRWIRDWIMPRGKAGKNKMIRNVGGLSLTRISTLQSLYRIEKSFRNRPLPSDIVANIPKMGDTSLESFGRRVLNDVEKLRENRVKQLASRISEAALGVGIEVKRKIGCGMKKRPSEKLEAKLGRRFAACDVIVIENLRTYKPDQLRTRRENRQLMNWSAAKVRDYLMDICKLNGLYFYEVMPNYTSRQDSRTGAPGMRCRDIAVADFVMGKLGIAKRIIQAQKKKDSDRTPTEKLLIKYLSRWKMDGTLSGTWLDESGNRWLLKDGKWIERNGVILKRAESPLPVRIPWPGGDIFVSAASNSPSAKGIQADLNAAANIGLQAVLDPDWAGRWWYVPCASTSFKPIKDRIKGSMAFTDMDRPLMQKSEQQAEEASKSGRDVVNLWRPVSSKDVYSKGWVVTKAYWKKVEEDVVNILLSAK